MKKILRNILLILSLALTYSYAFSIDNGSYFQIQYQNQTTNYKFWFDNDQAQTGDEVIINNDEVNELHVPFPSTVCNNLMTCFWEGHGYADINQTLDFSIFISACTGTGKGARQVFLYIPLTGSNSGQYKKVAFILWDPIIGKKSWKLGTNNSNPISGDGYGYYYEYQSSDYVDIQDNHNYDLGGTILISLVQDNLNSAPYLKITTYKGDTNQGLNPNDIVNTQITNTDTISGDIVDSSQLPASEMT